MKYLMIIFLSLNINSFSQSLDADYNGGEELIMTERGGAITRYRREKIYDLSIPLYSIYWDPSNNQYYYVKDGTGLTKTNGLTYKLDPKKEEQTFVPDIKDSYLQYAGYISTNERLYIDNRNKQQYIKILIPIKDSIEVVPVKETYDNVKWYVDYEYKIHQEAYPRSTIDGNLPF